MNKLDGKSLGAGLLGWLVMVLTPMNSHAQLAKTPPMGFNTWNNFGCNNISQTVIQGITDAMATNGMKDAGYTYVNVDDCWEGPRDANGFISATNQWTGNSLKSVADYVHSKGMKFGAYTSLGKTTCDQSGHAATYGFESQDVRQWVSWGVDYIKVDWCNVVTSQSANPGKAYKVLGDTIYKYAGPTSARPIVYSICNWGVGNPWTFGRSSGGQLWRTTGDINQSWGSITGNLDQQVNLFSYAGPGGPGESGGWNDPDMLEVGRGSLNADENKAHFGMWCLLTAPLIAGNDVRTMSSEVLNILINKEVIAVDQDSLGIQAQRLSAANNIEVWAKPMMGNCRALGLFNRSGATASITVNWADLNKWTTVGPWSATTSATVRDLWTKTDLGTNKSGSYSVSVPSHGLAMLKLTPTNSVSIVPIHPAQSLFGVAFGSDYLSINLQGSHSIQILDMTGRVLWNQIGTGPAQYTPMVKCDGNHILRIRVPESITNLRY